MIHGGPRLRFSPRALLATVTVCSVWLAWFLQRAEEQRRAVAEIVAAGGKVVYDGHVTLEDDGGLTISQQSTVLEFFSNLLGPDYLSQVTYADLPEQPRPGQIHLDKLPSLEIVALPVADSPTVKSLKRLKKLRLLWLTSTKLTSGDLVPLEKEFPQTIVELRPIDR